MTKKIYFYDWLKNHYKPESGGLQTAYELLKDKTFPKRIVDYIKLRQFIDGRFSSEISYGFHGLYNIYYRFLQGENNVDNQ